MELFYNGVLNTDCVTAASTGRGYSPLLKSKTNSKPSLKRWKAGNNTLFCLKHKIINFE